MKEKDRYLKKGRRKQGAGFLTEEQMRKVDKEKEKADDVQVR